MKNSESFKKNGYSIVKFSNTEYLDQLQQLISKHFSSTPTEWHKKDISIDDHILKVKEVGDLVTQSDLHSKLILKNIDLFQPLLGSDIDIQVSPHFRVSRPQLESDLVDWHRDTFYGNSPWELNLWFPIFKLEEGAGFRLLPGSHVMPSTNIHEIKDTNPYRSEVKKGSAAHQVGYVYLAKTDDTISNMKLNDSVLLRPNVGEAVFFFGCMVHRAQNLSKQTRISLDLRIKSRYAPTETKEGYYKTLSQGVVEVTAQTFLSKS